MLTVPQHYGQTDNLPQQYRASTTYIVREKPGPLTFRYCGVI